MADILIVDGISDNCNLLAKLLSRDGYSCNCVFGGREAIDYFNNLQELPRLVILDYAMPDIDGIQVLRHIRDTPAIASLRVLFFSAHEEPLYRDNALSSGADAYLPKSSILNLDRFLKIIRSHIGPSDGPILPPLKTDQHP